MKTTRYIYTALILAALSQGNAVAQNKGGFFGKVRDTFSTEIKIGNYTFKDGSVYTGEMKGRKPNGKGKTVFKNGDVYEGEYVKVKEKDSEFTPFRMANDMKDNGIKTSSMVTESTIL